MDSNELLDAILTLQPARAGAEGMSPEQETLNLIADLKEKTPVAMDFAWLKFKYRNDDSPLKVVLEQEVSRYNVLLNKMVYSLNQLEKGI